MRRALTGSVFVTYVLRNNNALLLSICFAATNDSTLVRQQRGSMILGTICDGVGEYMDETRKFAPGKMSAGDGTTSSQLQKQDIAISLLIMYPSMICMPINSAWSCIMSLGCRYIWDRLRREATEYRRWTAMYVCAQCCRRDCFLLGRLSQEYDPLHEVHRST